MGENGCIRLNIGAGDQTIPGFISIDKRYGHDAAKLDYPDNSVDEIYASHVLEHFPIGKVKEVLSEWVRVLKPGGRIRIAVPSIERTMRLHSKFALSWERANRCMMGGQIDEYDYHKCAFTEESLESLMRAVGLREVERCPIEYHDCSSVPVSIIRSGIKHAFRACDRKKLVGIAPEPRLNFSVLNDCQVQAAFEMGVDGQPMPIGKDSQVFWSKSMEIKISEMIRAFDPDYIITFDFDSGYTPDDIRRLLDHMEEDPSLGAIFPVQQHRHADHPLCLYPGRFDYTTKRTVCQFGHFGLTIIRREVFDILKDQRPWFFTMPSAQSATYEDPRESDGDISFWRLLIANGIKVAQANDVVIGHAELCMMWPHEGSTFYQRINDYAMNGKPDFIKFDIKDYLPKPARKREALPEPVPA